MTLDIGMPTMDLKYEIPYPEFGIRNEEIHAKGKNSDC
jgi:hypothetical protein